MNLPCCELSPASSSPRFEDDNVLEPADFEKLADEEKERIKAEVEVMQEQLQNVLYQVPRWERELREKIRELNQDVTGFVVDDLMADLREKYADLADVLRYLDNVKSDVSRNLGDFLSDEQTGDADGAIPPGLRVNPLRRYEVNLLVDSGDATGAPVIYDSNPSYLNLIGRVEQMAQMGALITDFTLIKPGLLHRANGGTLILDAIKVLTAPYAWDGLKRALQFGEIRIESPLQMLSLTSTISLEPEPIPLDIKVILLGEHRIYYLLSELDPEFAELFKVAADFDDELERDDESQLLYAQLIATIVRKEGLRPFDRTAVARVIDYSARLVSDSERLSARMQSIVDLLEEADHWADEGDVAVITADQVQQAIDAKIFRSDRIRDRIQEQTLRETVMIDTEGEAVGQINGLAVLQLGGFAFGKPSRITAGVRIGKGEVIDIEREVEMSGPLHSKGVLILTSYLQARYAAETAALAERQPCLRTVVQRRRRRQRLFDGTLCAAVGHRSDAHQAIAGGHRLGQPMGTGSGHRRRQREDRRLLRSLPGTRADRRSGRVDSAGQCKKFDAEAGGGLPQWKRANSRSIRWRASIRAWRS